MCFCVHTHVCDNFSAQERRRHRLTTTKLPISSELGLDFFLAFGTEPINKGMTSVSGYGCCYSRTAKCFNYNCSFFNHSNSTVCKKWRRVICFSLEETEPIQQGLYLLYPSPNYGNSLQSIFA